MSHNIYRRSQRVYVNMISDQQEIQWRYFWQARYVTKHKER